MGLLDRLIGQRVYLDTNVWVYALESYATLQADLSAIFDAIDRGEIQAVTSELTLAEVLVKPFMDDNPVRQAVYEQAIQNSGALTVVPVTRAILIEAARLRAVSSLRLPDAIHVATAILAQCPAFLTHDKRLKPPGDLNVVLLSESS